MQDRRDEALNKKLGFELAENEDIRSISVIVENLYNKDKRIQGDCISVLEQIALEKPGLVQDYINEFFILLDSKNNRLVWQSMIILAIIAELKANDIFLKWNKIAQSIENGSVITKDNGIKVLSKTASEKSQYNNKIFPFLLDKLSSCRPGSVPQYAESIKAAVNEKNQKAYLRVLNERIIHLTPPQQKRINKILASFDKMI